MLANREPEVERLRERAREAERARDIAVRALRKGCALTIAERERVLAQCEATGPLARLFAATDRP